MVVTHIKDSLKGYQINHNLRVEGKVKNPSTTITVSYRLNMESLLILKKLVG